MADARESPRRGSACHGTLHHVESLPSVREPRLPKMVTVIKPRSGLQLLNLAELWQYRELLYFLGWRDIKVRYKQTALGIAWAVLQPLAMMTVFTVFFGQLARIPSDGVPYPIFALSALIPWQLFAKVMASASDSLVRDERLISKVYFPRLLIPISTIVSALADFVIAMSILMVLMLSFGASPTAAIVWLPLFVLQLLVTALAIGFWLSAINVEFRDVRHLVPFLVQVWFFVTPVVYPSSLVPERYQVMYGLNPMVGVVEGFRWSLLGAGGPPGTAALVSVVVSMALFVGGLFWFVSRERSFADSLG
jgi:lipopolysaccharide transport system permease protein